MTYLSFSLSNLLNFDSEVASDLTFAEKLENILTTAVGGYLLVFAVLGLIWGILEIFSVAFGRKKSPEEASDPEPVTAPEPVVAPAVTNETLPCDDAEIVAAITAAISAYTDKPQYSFRVVSFRKKK